MILGKLLISATYAARMPLELYQEESDITFFGIISFMLTIGFIAFLFVLVRNLIRDACRLIMDTWRLKTRVPKAQVHHGIAFPKNMVVYILGRKRKKLVPTVGIYLLMKSGKN